MVRMVQEQRHPSPLISRVHSPPSHRFASIARLAGEQLGPKLAAIIPRLYRYLYDPNGKASLVETPPLNGAQNKPCSVSQADATSEQYSTHKPFPQVRDAMAHIWHALLGDPKAAVTQHFDGG